MHSLDVISLLKGGKSKEDIAAVLAEYKDEDWDLIIPYLAESMLLNVFWKRIEAMDATERLPADAQAFCRHYLELSIDRERDALQELQTIDAALRRSDLQLMLLKGAALVSGGLYKNEGERLFGDLDFLAKPGELEAVVTCLEGIGYKATVNIPRPIDEWFQGGRSHHLPRLSKEGCMFDLEIHMKPIAHSVMYPAALEARSMWSRQASLSLFTHLVMPAKTDLLFHAFYHTQVNDGPHLRHTEIPRAYLDVEAVLNSPGELDLKLLDKHVCRSKTEGYFRAFLERASEIVPLEGLEQLTVSYQGKRAWQHCLVTLGLNRSPAVTPVLWLKALSTYISQLKGNQRQREQFMACNPGVSSSSYASLGMKLRSKQHWKALFGRRR